MSMVLRLVGPFSPAMMEGRFRWSLRVTDAGQGRFGGGGVDMSGKGGGRDGEEKVRSEEEGHHRSRP